MEKEENLILQHSFRAIGTDISFDLVVPASTKKAKASKLLDKAERLVRREELIFSRFNPQSELSYLNNRLGQWTEASEPIIELAKKILRYSERSNGIFDPRIIEILEAIGYGTSFEKISSTEEEENGVQQKKPKIARKPLKKDLLIDRRRIMFLHRMDFSGLAKGYLADEISQLFQKEKFFNFIVDLGGDMFVAGQKNEGEAWYVGVEGVNEESILLKICDLAVATSGVNRRNWQQNEKKYHHLINPQRPEEFDFRISSVSVLAETVVEADYLAKIIFLQGLDGPEYCEKNKIAAIFVYLNRHYAFSSSMEKFLI